MRLAELAFSRTETLSVLIWVKGVERSKPLFGSPRRIVLAVRVPKMNLRLTLRAAKRQH